MYGVCDVCVFVCVYVCLYKCVCVCARARMRAGGADGCVCVCVREREGVWVCGCEQGSEPKEAGWSGLSSSGDSDSQVSSPSL